ncbi:hypothetical protein [Sphingopyxis sp. LC81]|uniref:hypothetical protein n=1 Tax=Sphingopyxis sp. LC81 TaxID=1502850 RepID=UPI001269AF22|nr:hypothetical protein [Sphingopyxis sp. LC81]
MVSPDDDVNIVRKIAQRRGRGFIEQALQGDGTEADELTIVSNVGVHPLPLEFIKGELYPASTGSLDFSSTATVNAEIDKIVKNLTEKLKEKRWRKIYLLPFGHAVISMNIKMVVFRVLRIETIEIFYFGDGKYGLIERDTRLSITQE